MKHLTNPNPVVITGLGVITPIGIGRDNFWENLMTGTCGVNRIHAFNTAGLSTDRAYEVLDFDPVEHLPETPGILGRTTQFALTAIYEALGDAGLEVTRLNPERTGLCLGSIGGELRVLEDMAHRFYQGREVDTWSYGQLGYDILSSQIARILGLTGPQFVVPTACASGNYALGLAFHLIHSGEVDVVIAGGADPLSHMITTGFNRLKAVDTKVCRPFDIDRKGMMIGEGSGIMVLETLPRARARGANIYAEIAGFGLSCDAFHATAMEPEGKGLALAIKRALALANISYDKVDYINAHGTGTRTNDKVETLAIKRVFKEKAVKLPCSSIKSMIGHAMGAASAIEAVACALVIERGAIPPTINFKTPDPECDLDIVPNHARELPAKIVLSNAAAFGGNNSCVVFRAVT